MQALLPGRVAWYATGRFYVMEDQHVFDAGYFLHLAPIEDDDLFCGARGESTAHFTFLAEPFKPKNVTNGDLSLGLDPTGDFTIWFNEEPGGDFDHPKSFGRGVAIARFRRTSIVVGLTVPGTVMSNVFSAALIESRPFTFRGRTYDLGRALPNGITQWGTAGTVAVDAPAKFPTVLPFLGSAIAVG